MDKQIKGYQLVERIGQGGFGEVYRAYQPTISREVAIKVIMPKYANQPDFIRNFETEAQIVARLEHPFITPLFDYWRDPNGAYLVMRYLRGGTLKQEMAQGQLSLHRVADILDNISSALWTAHRNQVAHRDIKPANILLDNEGRTYLSDFGLAITVGEDHYANLVGTWLYMPPERIQGQEQSHTVDVYSLGIVAYQMITGEYPFDRSTMKRLAQAHVSQYMPPISLFRSNVPPELDMVLQRATSKDPDDRYTDIRLFANDFRQIVQPIGSLADITQTIPIIDELINPYVGLRPFSEVDSRRFFGRTDLIKRLIERMSEDVIHQRFLALVGPSGSGKSSVIYAGLLPMLRAGVITGADSWYFASMTPGTQPFQNLVLALQSIAITPVEDFTEELVHNVDALNQIVPSLVGDSQHKLLLFIDQFEELFTQVKSEEARQQFLDLLTATITGNSNILIIITIRADFYDRPLRYEAFGKLIQERTEVILPLGTAELERVIVAPVQNIGLSVEPELIAEIIGDVKSEPGALPLLQYTLTELFNRRDDLSLTLKSYRDSGGVRGALARRADEVYQALSNQDRVIARQLFLRLVTLGEGVEDTRRRARFSELQPITDKMEQLEAVMNTFSRYRLLTFDNDPETREPTVEVAHEALIREWRQFQIWLDTSRDDLRLQRLIASEVADWKENQQDSSYLLRGNRLAQVEHWADSTNIVISQDEIAYIQASIQEREQEEQHVKLQQAKEMQLMHRASQRLRVILVLILIVSIGGGALTIGIIQQRDNAVQSQQNAERSLQRAYSSAFTTTAEQALSDGDYNLALAFALEAVELDEESHVAFNSLFTIAYGAGISHIIHPEREFPVYELALSDDGNFIASAQGIDYLQIIDQYLPPEERRKLTSVLFSEPADFSTIDYTQLPPSYVRIHDAKTGVLLTSFEGHTAPITSLGFVPSENELNPPTQAYSASILGEVLIWDIQTGDIIQRLSALPQGYNRLSISADGHYLLGSNGSDIDTDEDRLVIWDMKTYQEVNNVAPHASGLWDSAISGNGEYAISLYMDRSQVLWDTLTGEVIEIFELESNIRRPAYQVAISEDGERAVTNVGSGSVFIWEIAEDELDQEELSWNFEPVADIALAKDASRLVLIQPGGVFIDWAVEAEDLNDILQEPNTLLVSTALNADGTKAVFGLEDGRILIWDLTNKLPDLVQVFPNFDSDMIATFFPIASNDTNQLLVFDGDFEYTNRTQVTLSIWDIVSGDLISEWDTPHQLKPIDVVIDDTGRYALTFTAPNRAIPTHRNLQPKFILWDLAEQSIVQEIEPEFILHDAEFVTRDDDSVYAITGGLGGVMLWDMLDGQIIETYLTGSDDDMIIRVALTANQEFLFGTTRAGELVQWDFAENKIIRRYDLSETSMILHVFENKNWVVTAYNGRDIVIWDYTTGEQLGLLSGHTEQILSVDSVVTVDSESNPYTLMISSGEDANVFYWDMDVLAIDGVVSYESPIIRVEVNDTGVYHSFIPVFGDLEIWDVVPPNDEVVFEYIKNNRIVDPITPQDCIQYTIKELCDIHLHTDNAIEAISK